MDHSMILHTLLTIGIIVILIYIGATLYSVKEGFSTNDTYRQDPAFKAQVKFLSDKYTPSASAKRPVTDLLAKTITDGFMTEPEQNFVNFYALGCRYTGFVGPLDVNGTGFFDADIAVQTAVNAGCRVFVLEIDYMDGCTEKEGENKYFPRIVIRDVQNKLLINPESDLPRCNTSSHSNLKNVCDKINFYAFSSACQNNTDPVVIVLYFTRRPPGSYKSKAVLDYYSQVAKCLAPFKNRFLTNELSGGTFNRQSQEGKLLINNIANYNGKVLIFSNANTTGFREVQTYSPADDLDYLVNLRLSYTQTKLGITENDSGPTMGILETVENYLIIPSDRADQTVEQSKLHWTICFSKDPTMPVSSDHYYTLAATYGVHCMPIFLFDTANTFMFTDTTYKTYSFIPKPKPLRYIKPPVVTPAEPSPTTDAKQGKLREPGLP